jgi:hypothetical protein
MLDLINETPCCCSKQHKAEQFSTAVDIVPSVCFF